eukprot:CAMPEP_0195509290 /NCGR_PEP_ID=MMETSP0794_2-20130614/2261_1 /TAXON_ID=515487 /ORGANISM="Stephanopyxis turris, Strain CCMP 815" /LENGTH=73 /DNA_ID=CAMNT_0040636461 /DNA_START=90 /DNA_END=310 /DNA_ORIENTATION=-
MSESSKIPKNFATQIKSNSPIQKPQARRPDERKQLHEGNRSTDDIAKLKGTRRGGISINFRNNYEQFIYDAEC